MITEWPCGKSVAPIYDSAGASLGALADANLNQPGDVAFDAAGDL